MEGSEGGRHRSRVWRWIGIVVIVVLAVVAGLATTATIMLKRAQPILKGRVVQTLQTHFNSRIELDDFNVSVMRGLEVSGRGLRIFAPEDVVEAGATAPIFTVGQFSFRADVLGLFKHPTHVHTVHVSGLEIRIPPRQMRKAGVEQKPKRKIEMDADEIICTDSRVLIESSKPGKDPKDFELKQIVLRNVGRGTPLNYDATLVNAIPKGDIQAKGTFGPWNPESPGDSSITGTYRFDHADLNTIKGIGGTLSSAGQFGGQLNRIEVSGTTQTPNFSLDSANHPMPLSTKFKATVDGTSGDTYLQPVEAKLGRSSFTCSGSVVNVRGQGHIIDLDVDVPQGRLEDFLSLAVKTTPVVMTAQLGMKTKLHIRPGKESVAQKISMQGHFTMAAIHFTNPETQDKVDEMSERAQGHPDLAKAGADDVRSHMTGRFVMDDGRLRVDDLNYQLPGATVNLVGVYSLDGQQFEFAGKVTTQAKVSQMVKKGWKSALLKLADPFFTKDGAGAVVPVKISGTKSAPKFGLDFGGKTEKSLEERHR
ncbi:hypothetical protein GRAN_0350 [Granulicella sibirica]|uniref:AsmA-like C-terminal domain-containing protein n=1 Tax=Granulicella sibirica TaxID=2479048 RepID=A0A4Q0T3I3_9BACT|nr:hypothetical protein GRAN_0350 [Granulicella sibirica]